MMRMAVLSMGGGGGGFPYGYSVLSVSSPLKKSIGPVPPHILTVLTIRDVMAQRATYTNAEILKSLLPSTPALCVLGKQ